MDWNKCEDTYEYYDDYVHEDTYEEEDYSYRIMKLQEKIADMQEEIEELRKKIYD